MEKFSSLSSIVCPLPRANVDTDAIIPKQFLKSIHRIGFGPNLFDAWRYLDEGQPGMDNSRRPVNPDFVLNDARYQGAQILLAGNNFGCGSSREHAPWALMDYGFRAIIASSFADIFHQNCFRNGILPITLDEHKIANLFAMSQAAQPLNLTINLQDEQIHLPDGDQISFVVDSFRRQCLLNGFDDIDLTLQHRAEITAYEAHRQKTAPWLFAIG
ncbi:MAG: 3-isopropylmalate dehydratase small subunit [Pseudomonadota bacterium]